MMSKVFGGSRVLMAAAKSGAKSSAKSTAKPVKETTTSSRPNGLTRPVPVSPAMRKFLGVQEASRSDAVKKIWEYIKSNNLQDPLNKREICCDEKLKSIFNGKEKVGFLEVAKLMSPHFIKAAD